MLIVLATLFVGCKDEESKEYITISTDSKEMTVGEEFQYYVSVQGTSGSEYAGSITWSIETEYNYYDENGEAVIVADVAMISSAGYVTALNAGSARVIATLADGRYARASLYVSDCEVSGDSISIARSALFIATGARVDTTMLVVAESYTDVQKYPIELSLSYADGSAATPSTTYDLIPQDAIGTYIIQFTSGSQDENLVCNVTIGDYTTSIDLQIDYTVYMSTSPIDPTNPTGNISKTSGVLNLTPSASGNFTLYFYVEDDNNAAQAVTDVITSLTASDPYTFDGTASIILGTKEFNVQSTSPQYYSVTLPVSSGNVTGSGTLTVSLCGQQVNFPITVDDGTSIDYIFLSFDAVNAYDISNLELVSTYSQTVPLYTPIDPSTETCTVRVYYWLSPDDRFNELDWTVSLSGDQVVIPIGEDRNNGYTDFYFQVASIEGAADISFYTYNPTGDNYDYEQTITATITVQDNTKILVSSVEFFTKEQETSAKTLELGGTDNVEVLDATAATTWAPEYSIIGLEDGAEASIDAESGSLSITHAGVITVQVAAGGEGNQKYDEQIVTAKFELDQFTSENQIQINSIPTNFSIGDEQQLGVTLKANYSLYLNEYVWASSNEEVISISDEGYIKALSAGTSTISIIKRDDYNFVASYEYTITVKDNTIAIDFNDSSIFNNYYAVFDGATDLFWIDTENGSSYYYEFNVSTGIDTSGDAVYVIGTDITGVVSGGELTGSYILHSGSIIVSNGVMTFEDVKAVSGSITAEISGSKEILVF